MTRLPKTRPRKAVPWVRLAALWLLACSQLSLSAFRQPSAKEKQTEQSSAKDKKTDAGLGTDTTDDKIVIEVISSLASTLSASDGGGFIALLDRDMPGYGRIVQNAASLIDQADVWSSIDILSVKFAPNEAPKIDAPAHLSQPPEKPAEKNPGSEGTAIELATRLVDVDWFLQLSSKAVNGPLERRRERVTLKIAKVAAGSSSKWKVTFIEPATILDPIQMGR